jgi:radical SAM/Cys-rich protein
LIYVKPTEAVAMNAFLSAIENQDLGDKESCLKRTRLDTLQVNMGDLCNQSCLHCHVKASPLGKRSMSKKIVDAVVKILSKNRGLVLDITGGAPELNPHFDYFVVKARPWVRQLIVRTNLTVLCEAGRDHLPGFFRAQGVHLLCSLPCYTEKNVDSQRGKGAFVKSIKVLRALNAAGYAKEKELLLDIVYNPMGAYLPTRQEDLEEDYRSNLRDGYGVEFNRLITITNVPINRFRECLDSQGAYPKYLELLKSSFNPDTVRRIMCRTFLSVGFDGRLYDCDFNQSLGWVLKDTKGKPLTIEALKLKDLENRDIAVGEHCFSCTAGCGSSCQGALVT